jgi:hypothetical protein
MTLVLTVQRLASVTDSRIFILQHTTTDTWSYILYLGRTTVTWVNAVMVGQGWKRRSNARLESRSEPQGII